jgi:GH15 family glucan-1,4-alpha-glucosidase
MTSPYKPIEDYGLIGDLRTVALVGNDASIDYLCFPDFDSPAVFCAILDHKKGGHFQISPVLDGARRKQIYLPDTNVLLTRFLSHDGVAEVSDFMPIHAGEKVAQALVRRVKTVRGEVRFRMTCQPRFDYARAAHEARVSPGEVLFESKGADGIALRLRTPVEVKIVDGAAVAEFTLQAGQTAAFVLEDARATDHPSGGDCAGYVSSAFKETVNFWRTWNRRSTYTGRWREIVGRSALALKLLTSRKHGSVIAAATFSLPEEVGGERNWDYRYTWIRDASFTLYAFMRLGYTEEASAFMRWIEERCREFGEGDALQIMYGVDGRHKLTEETLPHLEGYRGSSPVRVGNGAWGQLQLDIYGELMDSVYLYNKYGEPVHHDLWVNLVKLIDWVCKNWRRKDEGIWEVRGGAQEFLYSRLMCWVAVDRGIRLAVKRSLPAPLESWLKVRDEIYNEIWTVFWSKERNAFIQHKGSSTVDASNLLMPLVKFISPTDPRWLATLKAIETDLVDDSLVYRYKVGEGASDGLAGEEGTFSICSFWYVECVARSGDPQKARFLFEKMLGYANHLGLYSEELGPAGEHLGNFPQAFTHLALISSAFELNRRLG